MKQQDVELLCSYVSFVICLSCRRQKKRWSIDDSCCPQLVDVFWGPIALTTAISRTWLGSLDRAPWSHGVLRIGENSQGAIKSISPSNYPAVIGWLRTRSALPRGALASPELTICSYMRYICLFHSISMGLPCYIFNIPGGVIVIDAGTAWIHSSFA